MSSRVEDIKGIAASLRHKEVWLSFKGCVGVQALAFTLVLLVHNEVARIPADALGAIIFVILIMLPVIWVVSHQVYLRTGKGRKVAVAYLGHRVPLDDWAFTRRELARLFKNGRLQEHISLKLVPRRFVDTEAKWDAVRNRYGFSAYLKVDVSPPVDGGTLPVFKFHLLAVTTAKLDRKFAEATRRHVLHLARPEGELKSVGELFNYQANNLFDMLLLLLAAIDFSEKRYHNAERMLAVLDNRTAEWLAEDQNPRRALRWLKMRCHTAPCRFKIRELPVGQDLMQALEDARGALPYAEQFPEVYCTLARAVFLADGDLEEALELEHIALERAEEPELRATALLGIGALNVLLARFHESRKYYELLIRQDGLKYFDIDDLVDFADHAHEVGYEHAIFMRAFYRVVRGDRSLSEPLKSEAEAWMNDDGSRRGLADLYRQERKKGAIASAKSVQREKRKGPRQRSNRKRK